MGTTSESYLFFFSITTIFVNHTFKSPLTCSCAPLLTGHTTVIFNTSSRAAMFHPQQAQVAELQQPKTAEPV